MKKKIFVENVIAFILFATLMIAGTDMVENLYKGIWHILVDVGIDRTVSEMISACSVLWAMTEFARGSVHFFLGLANKKKSEE